MLGLDRGQKGTLLGAKRGEEPFKEREQHVQSGSIKTTCPFGKSQLFSDVVPTIQNREGWGVRSSNLAKTDHHLAPYVIVRSMDGIFYGSYVRYSSH